MHMVEYRIVCPRCLVCRGGLKDLDREEYLAREFYKEFQLVLFKPEVVTCGECIQKLEDLVAELQQKKWRPMMRQGHSSEEMAVQLTTEELRALVKDAVVAALEDQSISPAQQVPGTQSPYLGVQEAAEYSRMAVPTIRQAIRSGRLVSHRFGRRVLLKKSELQDFIEREN